MLLALACLVAAAAAAPVLYDQRQDGDVNFSADVQNVVFVVAIPQKMSLPLDILDDFLKSGKPHTRDSGLQERADRVMEAFVEPNTPYQVEIGSNERSAEGDGRAVEVVIASRRLMGPEPQNESENESDELKLIGATEQCGPDRERDPVTLTCRFRTVPVVPEPQGEISAPEPEKDKVAPVASEPAPAPEVVPL